MIEIVANKTGEVLTILKIYSEGRTKSDWFEAIGKDGTIYELEIFGVTKNTKHCIRLLLNGKDLDQNFPFARQTLLDNSKQLWPQL